MNKKLISILIANLFVAAPAFAQSDFKLGGSVNVNAISVDDDGATDTSKLNEFRDMSDGGSLGFDIMGRGGRYWLDLFGENLGRDDHYVNLRGGVYDFFKYQLYTDQLKHNFLFGGRTPFTYSSPNRATATIPPSTNPATWNSVDIGYKRRDDGGYIEFQGANPWYFRVDGNQVTQSGSKYGSSSGGLSPGWGTSALVFPTDYTTRNATIEGGYSSKKMHFALSWMTSKFDTSDDFLDWTNGAFGGLDRTYLPSDNKYSRLLVNATIRQLPLGSTLALRFTDDEMKTDQTLGTTVLGPGGSIDTTGPNVPTYNGRVEHTTYTLALASAPMRNLDTRLFVNRWKRDDNSTHLVFSGTAASSSYMNEPNSIDKKNWGFDAYYRVNRQNRVGFGYDDLDLERHRHDFDKTRDKKWFAEWKTTMIENVSARVKYTDLKREANFLLANDGVNSGDVTYWNRFFRAYDATDSDQKSWKATIDFTPAEFLDVSLEATSKKIDYTKTVIGRLSDDRSEVYGSVSYGNPDSARWTVFGDVERVKYVSRHMVVPFGSTAIGTYDPFAAPSSSKYNWEGTIRDKNYSFGVALDFPATEKLMVKASIVRVKSDGSVDFESNRVGTPPAPMANYDDATRTTFNVKGVYKFSKAITLTAGYAYEKFDRTDVQTDGFQYVIPGSSNRNSYFMGYLANPQYKANVIYGQVSWNF